MNRTKLTAALLALVLLLCACGEKPLEETPPVVETGPLSLTLSLGESQPTLDPAFVTAEGGDTILYHLFENLMRWEDDGSGNAVITGGQALSYTVERDFAGNATYTFILRDDIFWSDGKAVTAHHYAAAWKRLADPATASPHRALMDCIAGYDAVQATGNPDLLAVTAQDAVTLVVELAGDPPYFLQKVCAGAFTVPVRPATLADESSALLTNGPYLLAEHTDSAVRLTKNEDHYNAANVVAQELLFLPSTGSESDYEKLLDGSLDLMVGLPSSALTEDSGAFLEPLTETMSVVLNTMAAPFDNPDVRAAFSLVISRDVVTEALADRVSRPAIGLVPYGVADYGIEDPSVDFRAHGQEIVTMDAHADYTADCSYARALLAGAGYSGGKGFPAVEYLYINTPENQAMAMALKGIWKEKLGVSVTLRAVTSEEMAQAFLVPEADGGETIPTAPFQMAAVTLSAGYRDALSILDRWYTGAPGNVAGYSSPAFDILLDAADAATMPETYDAYLHDAEAILLEDAAVIPVCYRGTAYQLRDGLTGLYHAKGGAYFLSAVTRAAVTTPAE